MGLFGTDGVRGVAGVDLTSELAHDLAVAAAHVLTDQGEFAGHRPVAIVGQDSRESGSYLEAAICKGLTESGLDVRKVGVIPTPAISFLVKELKADIGVMISASHNPARDNGIKFFARNGQKLDDAIESQIESQLGKPWHRPEGMEQGRQIEDKDSRETYISYLLSTIHTRFDGIKVVVDCANGAASFVAPEVLRRAGAEVIAISASPNGLNINDNCGSTHLENLIARVKSEKADVGIAHDGDADRVLAVDHEGNIVDGDHILGILADHTELPTKTIVGTVMTNLGLIRALESRGTGFVSTPVGDRYVLEKMLAEGHTLGGEQSGHIILKEHANTGDGLLTALHLMQVMAETGKSLKELSQVMIRFPQVLVNVRDVDKSKLNSSATIARAISDFENGLGDGGRILVRSSGTEPLVRVMVEAESLEVATQIANELAELVRLELK